MNWGHGPGPLVPDDPPRIDWHPKRDVAVGAAIVGTVAGLWALTTYAPGVLDAIGSVLAPIFRWAAFLGVVAWIVWVVRDR